MKATITNSLRFRMAHRSAKANMWRIGSRSFKRENINCYSDLFRAALKNVPAMVERLEDDLCYVQTEMLKCEHHMQEKISQLMSGTADYCRWQLGAVDFLEEIQKDMQRYTKLKEEHTLLKALYVEAYGLPEDLEGECAAICAKHSKPSDRLGSFAISNLIYDGFHLLSILKVHAEQYQYVCYCGDCSSCAASY